MFRSAISKSRTGLSLANVKTHVPRLTQAGTSARFLGSKTSSTKSCIPRSNCVLADTKNTIYTKRRPSNIVYFSTSQKYAIIPEGRDKALEKALQQKKLESHPDEVTTTSSVRAIVEASQATPKSDPALAGGLKGDFNMIKETFALREVPKEVTFLGLAGLIPYVTTSATTLFLAYDVKNIHQYGTGYIFNESQATALLNFLEPVQIGYGAVILSFLGAIHWGLEFAKFGGSAPYRRYGLGILAPIIAWPTVFLPYDYALLAQFGGFVGMYFADAQITSKGWAPKWYTTYRFILTFVVGASIVMSLVGRGQIGDALTVVSSPVGRAASLKGSQRIGLEKETGGNAYQKKLEEEEEVIKENRKAKEEEEKKKTEELEEGSKRKDEKKVGKKNDSTNKGSDSEKHDKPKNDKSENEEPSDDKSSKGQPNPGGAKDTKTPKADPSSKKLMDDKSKDDKSKDEKAEDAKENIDNGSQGKVYSKDGEEKTDEKKKK